MPENIIQRNNVTVRGSDGPVLLYAHGFGCNQNMWSQVAPAFLEGYRVVLFDYVGSGASSVMDFDHRRYSTLNGYARDVLDVCEALDLTSGVTFVGHSVSCSVGMLASLARPGLFESGLCFGCLAETGAAEDHDGVLDAQLTLRQVGFEHFQLEADAAGFAPQQELGIGEGQAVGVGLQDVAAVGMGLQVGPGIGDALFAQVVCGFHTASL